MGAVAREMVEKEDDTIRFWGRPRNGPVLWMAIGWCTERFGAQCTAGPAAIRGLQVREELVGIFSSASPPFGYRHVLRLAQYGNRSTTGTVGAKFTPNTHS